MTNEERMKKVDEARKRYGRPFVHERPMKKPVAKKRYVLCPREFPHQDRPFNV